MATTAKTMYLRPPKPPRPKKAAPKTPKQEIHSFLFKYRVQLIPFLISFAVLTFGVALGPIWWGTLILIAVPAALAVFLYQDRIPVPARVPWFRLERPVERWYAAACAGTCSLWYLGATWHATKPGPRSIAVLIILTCLCAAPWWHHRRIRGSVPVRFHGLRAAARKFHLEQARKLIVEWAAFTSAGHAQGTRLRFIDFNPWSVTLGVQLRRGATIGEFTPRRLAKLESAFGEVQAGSARVERIGRSARYAKFRFMLRDPHENPISPPETGDTRLDRIIIGLFETGEEILFTLVNTLIAGATGSGKSGIINMIIRALARIPTVAILGIDLKPGAPELGKWEDVMHSLAKNPAEARDLMEKLLAGLETRGTIMSQQGIRKWKATRHQPFIVLIVDEVQELKVAGLTKLLDRIAAIIRAYGGAVVVATQYPTKDNLSATLKGNCPQKFGCRTEDAVADRVIFGESATRVGWRPSMISTDRPGSFLVRSPLYKVPLLGRAFWQEDDQIDREAAMWAPQRTRVDDPTWTTLTAGQRVSVESGDAQVVNLDKGERTDIVDAVVVDDDPAERILGALRRGRTRVRDICEDAAVSPATAYRKLNDLREQGLVDSPKRGVWEIVEGDADSQA